jgi:hypothetical protein
MAHLDAVYWLFDLAHELAHIALGHIAQSGVVDVESMQFRSSEPDADEREANAFALRLLLPDHVNLIRAVREEARGSHLRFKGAVATVAKQANVTAGLLGMVAAFELREVVQDKDRWGSASNLARVDGAGRPVVQRAVSGYLNVDGLSAVDAALVNSLVTPSQGTTER